MICKTGRILNVHMKTHGDDTLGLGKHEVRFRFDLHSPPKKTIKFRRMFCKVTLLIFLHVFFILYTTGTVQIENVLVFLERSVFQYR